ncbi:PFL_4669 family integrating conjugative element protein [Azotobacter vinelandii]|uniref:PFL_4669 family integrating conjugative element protein n=1 Tax=Azotobacter vinelandii TaxID=354 RepID=UPI000AA8B329|nr:TIGR03761 family integrating conjugative element protein [Azotobacter vinelandii]
MVEPVNPGALRSKIELKLHTYHAVRIWWGRGVESGRPQIIGMRQYLALAGRIQQAAAIDDPYADFWMLAIDRRIEETRRILEPLLEQTKAILASIPEELTVEDNVSQKPFTTGVYPGGQQGWLGIHVLIQYDRVVRNILLTQHVALITRRQANQMLVSASKAIRSLCECTRRYPGPSGTTRDDFAANNARARAAIERFGELPKAVLEGTQRSPFAPLIRKPSQKASSEEAEELMQQDVLEDQASKAEDP